MRILLVGIGVIFAEHCNISRYNQRYKFFGCKLLRDGLNYPGDDGIDVFQNATCRRVACLSTKVKIESVTCGANGKFQPDLPPCGHNEDMTEALWTEIGRLSTSGSSGFSHVTSVTEVQKPMKASEYPKQIIIYGSFTPGGYDIRRLSVLGSYSIYNGKGVNEKLTGGKPIYKHDNDPDIFFSFHTGTMSWRITTRPSIAKINAICVFKSMYGIMHDPTKFATWMKRQCYLKGQWRDTDMIISDVSPKLRIRQRLCPKQYRGTLANAHSEGKLKLNLEGKGFSEFFTASRVLEETFGIYDEFNFKHNLNEVNLVQAQFESNDALCLAELTIMKGTTAINLLQIPLQNGNRGKKTVKLMKWSHGWMTSWWDKNYFEDSAYPKGEVALVNHLDPATIKELNHHYYKAVDAFREWALPKVVLPTPPLHRPPTKQPIHNFDSLIVTTSKTPTTPVPATSTSSNSLFCSIDDLKQAGLRVSKCKFTSAYKYLQPLNSNSNQGLINGKVLNGAQCKMACSSYKKQPFSNSKMQCLCTSLERAKFKVFASLSGLISQTNPLKFLRKQCHWYDRTKGNKDPVSPIDVFPNSQCPSGCKASWLKVDNDCPAKVGIGKKCKLSCPKKATPTKCIWNKQTNTEQFTKTQC